MKEERKSSLISPPEHVIRDIRRFQKQWLSEKFDSQPDANPLRLSKSGACRTELWTRLYYPQYVAPISPQSMARFQEGNVIHKRLKLWLGAIYGDKYRGFTLMCKACNAVRTIYTENCHACGSPDYIEREDAVEVGVPIPAGTVIHKPANMHMNIWLPTEEVIDLIDITEFEAPEGAVFLSKGHYDGILDCPWDGVTRIVELKSMSSYAYKKAEDNNLSYDYACQASSYLHATGLTETLFYFYRKETGAIRTAIYQYEPHLVNEYIERIQDVLKSGKNQMVKRDYAPIYKTLKNGDRYFELDFPCSYCDAKSACYPTFSAEPAGPGRIAWRDRTAQTMDIADLQYAAFEPREPDVIPEDAEVE